MRLQINQMLEWPVGLSIDSVVGTKLKAEVMEELCTLGFA